MRFYKEHALQKETERLRISDLIGAVASWDGLPSELELTRQVLRFKSLRTRALGQLDWQVTMSGLPDFPLAYERTFDLVVGPYSGKAWLESVTLVQTDEGTDFKAVFTGVSELAGFDPSIFDGKSVDKQHKMVYDRYITP